MNVAELEKLCQAATEKGFRMIWRTADRKEFDFGIYDTLEVLGEVGGSAAVLNLPIQYNEGWELWRLHLIERFRRDKGGFHLYRAGEGDRFTIVPLGEHDPGGLLAFGEWKRIKANQEAYFARLDAKIRKSKEADIILANGGTLPDDYFRED